MTDLFCYSRSVPRYSSYPLEFDSACGQLTEIEKENYYQVFYQEISSQNKTWLYLHIPYCFDLCNFCGLNIKITKSKNEISTFAQLLSQTFKRSPSLKEVQGLSIGGGTPNLLSNQDLEILLESLFSQFHFSSEHHFQIEIDPRYVTKSQLEILKRFGFKNLIVGIQDLDHEVLGASNRHLGPLSSDQGLKLILNDPYFSVTVELIAGLIKQTALTLKETIQKCLDWGVNSFALYPLVIAPWNPNAKIHLSTAFQSNLSLFEKKRFELYQEAISFFKENGLMAIGPGFYCRPDFWWHKNLIQKNLFYTPSGPSPFHSDYLLAFGPSAFSSGPNLIMGNERLTDLYLSKIEKNLLLQSVFYPKSKNQILYSQFIKELFSDSKAFLPDFILAQKSFNEVADFINTQKLAILDNKQIEIGPKGREYLNHLLFLLDPHLQS